MDPDQTQGPVQGPPKPSDLELERIRLKAEIDALQALVAAPPDPNDKFSEARKMQAQQRLEKLNDDYRQVLIASKTPASATTDITRSDGSVWRIGPDNKPVQVLGPGGKPLGSNTVQTNTTDQYVVSVNQTTGALETVKNPNYVPPKPGQVTANTSDEFIVTMGPDGTLTPTKNPNYAPKPTALTANTTEKFIVRQNPDGTVTSVPNPNYNEKPTTIAGTAGTDTPFIMQQQPDGSLKQVANPNYVPKTPTAVSADTNSPFIVRQNPDGSVSQIPNPNYLNKPSTVTTDTSSPFIVQQRPDGTISQVVNPNYVKPKPTQIQNAGADQAYISIMDNEGKVTSVPNPSFQPKTQADIVSRVGQIQTLMQAKSAEVQAKVGKGNYSAEDALKEFNTWYDANVAPQQQLLQAAQEQVQFAQGQEIAKTRTNAFTAAHAGGTGAVDAFKALAGAHPMGQSPGFAAASAELAKGKIPTNVGDLAWKGPNPVDLYQQGTMNALKYIDPSAAAANGMPAPNLQGIDIGSAIGAKNYAPPGLQPAPDLPPSPATPMPSPPVPITPAGSGSLLPPGWAGTNLDPNVQASGGVPPGYPRLQPVGPPSWNQAMPNFGAPRNPWDMAPPYNPNQMIYG